LIGNGRTKIEKLAANRIIRRKRSDHAIEFIEQGEIRRELVETLELSAALFAHRKTQSMPDSSAIITFPSNLRNVWLAKAFGVRRCAATKCSTSVLVARLRGNCDEGIVDL